MSPVVRMALISIRSGARPQALARRPATSRAWNHRQRRAARADAQNGCCGRGICIEAYNIAMIILGIETTCDETAAAVVSRTDDGRGRFCRT